MIGPDFELVHHFHHRHAGAALQYLGEDAGVAGVEMRDQHKGHTVVGRERGEELLEGLQSAGGSTQSYDGEAVSDARNGVRFGCIRCSGTRFSGSVIFCNHINSFDGKINRSGEQKSVRQKFAVNNTTI